MSTLLGEIDMQAILADLPTDQRDGGSLIGHGAEGIVEGPKDYLLRYFRALQEFYEKASRQGLLVVLWWDGKQLLANWTLPVQATSVRWWCGRGGPRAAEGPRGRA